MHEVDRFSATAAQEELHDRAQGTSSVPHDVTVGAGA
jgi:hypothetical protein